MPAQHDEVVDRQRRKVILDLVLSDVPLHPLLQDNDLVIQYLQTSDGNERPRETFERDTIDAPGDGGDPRVRIDDVRTHIPSHCPAGVLLGKWSAEHVIVSLIFDLAPRRVIRVSNFSPRGKENDGTRDAGDTDSRGLLLIGEFYEVAT
jgi:hypothetical protein